MQNRPTSIRDPALPSGGIFISVAEWQNTNPKAEGTGSQYFSANIDDAWYVINAKGVISGSSYATEQLAANAAATANGQTAPNLEVDR
jgi:hypothetical protein